MTNEIRSGNIESGFITPTGLKKKIPVDNPYVTKDEFIEHPIAAGLGLSTTTSMYINGVLDKMILKASAQANRICRRYFDTQTIDETKTGFRAQPFNPQLTTVVLNNRPFRKVNSIYIQVLKWFIQVDTSSQNSYLQEFPDFGYYKIVPLLSTSGTGVGSPIPAAILDKVALGVLWTNYTSGYGTDLSGMTLDQPSGITDLIRFQAPLGSRLIAPDQTLEVYKNTTLLTIGTDYTVDYPNAIITLKTAASITDVITANYVSNESVPFDIKEAVILLAAYYIGQAASNPLGADSLGIQTYSVSYGEQNKIEKRAKEMLDPFVNRNFKII
jgi:hypothetical protein